VSDQARHRILVYGAGAVGSLLGGILAGNGHDVTLLGRGSHIEAIQNSGLLTRLHDRQFRTHPGAGSSSADISPPYTMILLCVRSGAVERSLGELSELLAPDGTLVTMQNGIGSEELVQDRLPDLRHVAGSLTMSASLEEPDIVMSTSRSSGIAFAPVSDHADASEVAGLFAGSGIPTAVLDDYRSMKWSKLLLNQMANAIPAILDWTPGQLYRHPMAFSIEQAMLRETLQVLNAGGIRLVSLPGFPVPLLRWVLRLPGAIARRLLVRRVEGGRGNKLPSLLIDLNSGRTELEADWLYGAVAEHGDEWETPAPVNRRITSILNGIARNAELRAPFRDNPERLLRNVALADRDSIS
jgi:2-dehydropantoate 2-reductase